MLEQQSATFSVGANQSVLQQTSIGTESKSLINCTLLQERCRNV